MFGTFSVFHVARFTTALHHCARHVPRLFCVPRLPVYRQTPARADIPMHVTTIYEGGVLSLGWVNSRENQAASNSSELDTKGGNESGGGGGGANGGFEEDFRCFDR